MSLATAHERTFQFLFSFTMIKIFIPRDAEKQVKVLHNALIVVVALGNGGRQPGKGKGSAPHSEPLSN